VGADDANPNHLYIGPYGVHFDCGALTVPVDHGLSPGRRVPGQFALQVAAATNYTAPRGVLLWLVGGPGEAGSRITDEIAHQFSPAVLRDYRLVLISGRGTGENALNCPGLQQAMPSSPVWCETPRVSTGSLI
jgi:hypothetical protein